MVDIGGNAWISSQCVVFPETKFPSYSVCALGFILNKGIQIMKEDCMQEGRLN